MTVAELFDFLTRNRVTAHFDQEKSLIQVPVDQRINSGVMEKLTTNAERMWVYSGVLNVFVETR